MANSITSDGFMSGTPAEQAANTVYAGPSSGVAKPTFRSLVATDLPTAVMFYAYKGGGHQSISSSTWTTVTDMTIIDDTEAGWASYGWYVVQTAGLYIVTAQINWQPSVAGAAYYVGVGVNGTINGGGLIYAANTAGALSSASYLLNLDADDIIDLRGYSDAFGGATIIANPATYIKAALLARLP